MDFPFTKEGHLAAVAAHQELRDRYPALQDELSDVHIIFWFPLPPSMIVSTTEISAPGDLKGLKVGCEAYDMEIVEAAGGAPVHVIPPDLYMNLEKGVVDASFVGWNHVFAHKLNEVATYYLLQYFGNNCTTCQMRLETWNKLSPEMQGILTEVSTEANVLAIEKMLELSEAGRQLAIDSNRTMVTPTPEEAAEWDAMGQLVVDGWLADMESRGVTSARDMLSDLKKMRDAAY